MVGNDECECLKIKGLGNQQPSRLTAEGSSTIPRGSRDKYPEAEGTERL
jgi:hypothetical protein